MELSVRDWMIIIGVLLIIAVLLDGYRRMRDPNRIRVSLTDVPEGSGGDDDIGLMRELPNGGARVAPRPAAGSSGHDSPQAGEDGAEGGFTESAAAGVASGGEPPLLTEAVADAVADAAENPVEPVFQDEPAPAATAATTEPDSQPAAPTPEPVKEPDPDPLFDDPASFAARQGENLDLLDGISADSRQEASTAPVAERPEAEEVLMLHVVSRDPAGFSGEDILQVLLAYNLRFGEMNFFHRHEESAGRGPIQFSVANMLNPGVFDIDAMSNFSTTGLIFFVSLPGPANMMAAFELMLKTAQGVAEHLSGDVQDESRSAVTRQTLEHMRQRIRELERKLLATAQR